MSALIDDCNVMITGIPPSPFQLRLKDEARPAEQPRTDTDTDEISTSPNQPLGNRQLTTVVLALLTESSHRPTSSCKWQLHEK
jgi:hypothetical protein